MRVWGNMLKEKVFRLIDLIIFFNVFMFAGAGFFMISTNIPAALLSFGICLFNIGYIVMMIRLRLKYNKEFIRNIEQEIKSEEKIDASSKKTFNTTKQVMLENRIEDEIMDNYPDAKIIRNAYIPKNDDTFSEIDLIAIHKTGIYIIESKNITGKIIGGWKDETLQIQHPGGKEYTIQNPIQQNTSHYKNLKNLLGMDGKYFRSIIVLGDLAYFKDFKDVPFFANVCHVKNLAKSMDRLSKKIGLELNDSLVNRTYEDLLKFAQKTDEIAEKHIGNIKNNKLNHSL